MKILEKNIIQLQPKKVFNRYKCGVLFLLIIIFSACNNNAYIYTSFHEPADAGLRLLYSYNGYEWKDLNKIFLTPKVGDKKIMRDPSMVQGPDGVFRLVWTSSWKGERSFGYANSKDLLHWSDQKLVPVMQAEPTAVNVWAPEIFYSNTLQEFIIIWSSTIPGRFAKGIEEDSNNHRLYYVTTKDFKTFSKEKLYFDPGFSSIDATLIQRGTKDYVLVFKDNTRPNRNIKVAFSKTPLGPFQKVSNSLTPGYSEGPATLKKGKDYFIYYDWYNHYQFGAIKTRDFAKFTDITSKISIPKGHKHGTILKVKKSFLKKLIHNINDSSINHDKAI